MELEELYEALERLEHDGEIVNAYGGSENDTGHLDGLTLADFIEYIYENYPGRRPMWIETFFQVFNWQYSAMYEGLDTYYLDSYGDSPYNIIIKVADYLKDNGYTAVAEQYTEGINICRQDKNPYKKTGLSLKIEKWINWNTETVWEFYLDILKKHKNDWPDKL